MEDPASALHREVDELPLGTRRSLARGMDLNMLEQLLLDPDPVVLDQLLRNPRVTEAHAIRIAARRPISEAALRAIAESARFGVRPHVRVALARNPYCPTELSVRLIGSLTLPVLREMQADATLGELLDSAVLYDTGGVRADHAPPNNFSTQVLVADFESTGSLQGRGVKVRLRVTEDDEGPSSWMIDNASLAYAEWGLQIGR